MGENGKLVWITGLSGVGKTSIAKQVNRVMKQQNLNYVHLDGDDLRDILGELASYSFSGRRRTAEVYAKLCKFLTGKEINVIISTISLFHYIHEYNRENNKDYYEILLEVDKSVLVARNKKELYNPGTKNVMGIDQKPEFPKNPDLILKNNIKSQLKENVVKIIELISCT